MDTISDTLIINYLNGGFCLPTYGWKIYCHDFDKSKKELDISDVEIAVEGVGWNAKPWPIEYGRTPFFSPVKVSIPSSHIYPIPGGAEA